MTDTIDNVSAVPVVVIDASNQQERTQGLKRIPGVGNGNLVDPMSRTPEERRAMMSKCGIASQKKQKKKRLLRDAIQQILSTPMVKDGDYEGIRQKLQQLGVEDPTYADALMAVQLDKSVKRADTEAAKFVRDTSGERPADVKDVRLQGTTTVELTGWSTEELQQRLANLSDD